MNIAEKIADKLLWVSGINKPATSIAPQIDGVSAGSYCRSELVREIESCLPIDRAVACLPPDLIYLVKRFASIEYRGLGRWKEDGVDEHLDSHDMAELKDEIVSQLVSAVGLNKPA